MKNWMKCKNCFAMILQFHIGIASPNLGRWRWRRGLKSFHKCLSPSLYPSQVLHKNPLLIWPILLHQLINRIITLLNQKKLHNWISKLYEPQWELVQVWKMKILWQGAARIWMVWAYCSHQSSLHPSLKGFEQLLWLHRTSTKIQTSPQHIFPVFLVSCTSREDIMRQEHILSCINPCMDSMFVWHSN